ncbi:DoxX family protein [Streptomyces melanogenes]|uniref:DoxX family protein n=1 Tax=Streptomyces melanogenes TaxID=67326 RepID=UPI00167E1A1F|nr:DoxX family protein [Streptomyces melanogenes]GGP39646.1 integral membrane protein [Streptomyces melanogenes]
MASPTFPSALNTERAKPYVLALFRIVTGFLFACHGAASLFGWFGGAAGTGGTLETGAWPNWYAAAIQLVGGLLIMAGLFTRSAAFLSSGSMAYAYFDVHQSGALLPLQNGGENAAMFSWVFLLLVFTGPGALALDQLLGGRATAALPEAGAAATPSTPAGTAR